MINAGFLENLYTCGWLGRRQTSCRASPNSNWTTDMSSLYETFQVMEGGEGEDTFVIKEWPITVAIGGEGIDKFYVGENWVQTVIFADGINEDSLVRRRK